MSTTGNQLPTPIWTLAGAMFLALGTGAVIGVALVWLLDLAGVLAVATLLALVWVLWSYVTDPLVPEVGIVSGPPILVEKDWDEDSDANEVDSE